MSISAPALPFDLACKGAFVDAPGVTSDSPSALGGDLSLSFATVLAGAVPATQPSPAPSVLPLPLPLAGAMEPALSLDRVVPTEHSSSAEPESATVETEDASDDLAASAPTVPFYARHALSPSRPAANPVSPGLRLGLEGQRRPADGRMPADGAVLAADVTMTEARPKVNARSGEADGVLERTETDEPLPVDLASGVVAPTMVPGGLAPVAPAIVSPVFCDIRLEGENVDPEATFAAPVESDDGAQSAVVVTSERGPVQHAEACASENVGGFISKSVHVSRPDAPALPDPDSVVSKSQGGASPQAEPSKNARPDLPGALQKGDRVPVSQNASTEPQGKGSAVARTSRASARAQEVAAAKTDERTESASSVPAASKAFKTGSAERSASPDGLATAGQPVPVRTETEPASVVRPPVETPWMAVPRPCDPVISSSVAPVVAPTAIPVTPADRLVARSARFSAPSSRPALERASSGLNESSPAPSGQGFGLPEAPAVTDIALPVANGLNGESAWRRLPLAVQERLTFAATSTPPVSASPSWTPLRTVQATVLPAPDAESLLSLEQAALDLVSEVTADGLPVTRMVESDSAPLVRRVVVPESMEKIAADLGDAFRDRVKERVQGEPDSKRNLLSADQKEFATSKFILGTETADRRALMHPDASSYRSPKAREESFSISSGLSALTPGVLTEFTAESVESSHSSSAAQSVRQIVDVADKLWATDRPSTHLKLKLDDVGVAVRVEYRDGEITATFQTESPELRERLAAAWQAQVVSLSDHKPYRLAEPVFNSPSSSPFSGGAAGQEFSSGGDNARQFAQSRQSETPVMYPHPSSSRSEAASTAAAEVRPATPVSTSARLHAFA
jgi:hypothetical protein